MSNVYVSLQEGQLVKRNENKPEYGSICFKQERFTLKGTFLNKSVKTCYMAGKYEDLVEYADILGIKADTPLPGVISVMERFTPFYEDQSPKINPTTGNIVLVDGAQIYQQTIYDPTGESKDQLIVGCVSIGPYLGVKEKKIESLSTR